MWERREEMSVTEFGLSGYVWQPVVGYQAQTQMAKWNLPGNVEAGSRIILEPN